MKSISNKLASLLLALGALSPAAHAVNDLPGGPAVRQLNLHPAATRIAAEQAWLHWFMLIICIGDLHRRVRRDVLFHLEAPQVAGPQGRPTSTNHVTVEVIWTIVPFLIVIGMALPATKVWSR